MLLLTPLTAPAFPVSVSIEIGGTVTTEDAEIPFAFSGSLIGDGSVFPPDPESMFPSEWHAFFTATAPGGVSALGNTSTNTTGGDALVSDVGLSVTTPEWTFSFATFMAGGIEFFGGIEGRLESGRSGFVAFTDGPIGEFMGDAVFSASAILVEPVPEPSVIFLMLGAVGLLSSKAAFRRTDW